MVFVIRFILYQYLEEIFLFGDWFIAFLKSFFHLQLSLYSLSLMCRVLETVSSTIFMTSRNTNVICVQDTNMPFFKSGHVKIGTLHIVNLYIALLDMELSTLNSCLNSDTLIIFLISIVFCKTFAVCNLPLNIFFRFFGVLVD